jgi:hypothetical protein
MAKCDEGYLCEVCGEEVEGMTESDLYLRYVIGEVDPEQLHTMAERHILCNPILAQFITDETFTFSGEVPEGFRIEDLDAAYVRERRTLVTRGWRRLKEVAQSELPIVEYPLEDARARWGDAR